MTTAMTDLSAFLSPESLARELEYVPELQESRMAALRSAADTATVAKAVAYIRMVELNEAIGEGNPGYLSQYAMADLLDVTQPTIAESRRLWQATRVHGLSLTGEFGTILKRHCRAKSVTALLDSEPSDANRAAILNAITALESTRQDNRDAARLALARETEDKARRAREAAEQKAADKAQAAADKVARAAAVAAGTSDLPAEWVADADTDAADTVAADAAALAGDDTAQSDDTHEDSATVTDDDTDAHSATVAAPAGTAWIGLRDMVRDMRNVPVNDADRTVISEVRQILAEVLSNRVS